MNIFSQRTIMLSISLLMLVFISACKDEKEPEPQNLQAGNLQIAFVHKWGMTLAPFYMNRLMVQPKTGDSMTFTTLKYYVSNIMLKKNDGSWWAEPNSYYLVDALDSLSCILNVKNIPAGTYTELSYTMGVDSLRNVSGAQTGALSTANGMFWSWNSGYIMIKAEGLSPDAPSGDFALHLGGFTGVDNVVTVKTTNMGGQTFSISGNSVPKITLVANPARFWHTNPSLASLSKIHMPGPSATQAAKDFYSGIFFDKLNP